MQLIKCWSNSPTMLFGRPFFASQAPLLRTLLEDTKYVTYIAPGTVDSQLHRPISVELCNPFSGCLSVAEVSEHLGLTNIKNRQWSIQKTSAVSGEGLYEGLEWYVNWQCEGGQLSPCG